MTTKEEVLQNCTVDGTIVKLPNVQLDRKFYQEVAKALVIDIEKGSFKESGTMIGAKIIIINKK